MPSLTSRPRTPAAYRIQSKRKQRSSLETMAEQEPARSAHPQPVPAPTPEAWIKTELARHPQRPYPMDFIDALFTDFNEIHGDRAFGDDPAMACGMAAFHGQQVMVIANLKG